MEGEGKEEQLKVTATRSRTAIKSAKQNQGKKNEGKREERVGDGKRENECECGQTQGVQRESGYGVS